MKIVIFGATGIVGKAVVNEALAKGHEVTVLTRDARRVAVQHARLRVVEGNVTDEALVVHLLKGQDAVVQTLGIGGKGNGKPTHVVSDANAIIMRAMEQAGVKRLIAISVIGAGDSLAFLPWAYRRIVLPWFMKWFRAIIDDKNRMEQMIMKSHLDWTIVRCTTVKPLPRRGRVQVSLDGKKLKFSVTAEDMAAFMVNQLTSDSFVKKTPTISN